MNSFSRHNAAIALMTTLAFICIGVPLYQLVTYPPYIIALTLPQTWQGGIEALAVFALLATAQIIKNKSVRLAAFLVISELYLRRHAVDVSAIVDLIYFEIIVGVGFFVATRIDERSERNIEYYLRAFVFGICIWSVCAWGLSAVGVGSVKALRILTAVIGLSLLILRPKPLSAFIWTRTFDMPLRERMLIAAFAAWLLVLFAKTGVAMSFDALWYSLRGDHVLVGAGSAFKSTGLVSSVYYFPKLYELILIPVSGLGISSVIAGISIFVLATLALAAYEATRILNVESRNTRLLITLTCISIPAISNSAIDPKPELIAALFVVLTWLCASRFIATRKLDAVLWTFACAILATQAKLVAIPFVAAIAIAVVFMTFRYRPRATSSALTIAPTPRLGVVAAALALVVGIFVTSRTLLLTGMPTIGPDALVRVWRAFGFGLTFPTGTMNWMKPPDWNDVPALAVDVLFRPQLLLNHITFWNANIWFWAACAVLLLPRLASNNRPQTLPLFATGLSVVVCGLLLLFGISYGVRGGDGNYYISAVVIATILALVTITRRLPSSQLMTTCLIAFVSFHMCVSFISADWMSGTRAFDLKFNRSVRTFRHTNRQLLASNGLYAIEQYLKHLHRPVRVVGCMEDNLNMRLSARTESIQQIAYSRVDFLASPKAFLDFLQDDKIDFFIVPAVGNSSAYCYDNSEVREATDALLHDERVDKINDMGYVLLDLSTWSQLRQR